MLRLVFPTCVLLDQPSSFHALCSDFMLVLVIIRFTHVLQWLNDVFLRYFIDWREQVRATPNMTAAEQNKMFISQQTFHGIVMTGN